ncbi:MAG: hypothetical protein K8T90_09305 [Planctomycetes bacterium]|nr:hypothetical protein [Planctomycetota bacterium]
MQFSTGCAATLAALALSSMASPLARADLDAVLANGDRVTGVLDPGTESETFRVTCPRGAKLLVQVKPGKGGGAVRVRIDGAGDDQEKSAKKVKLARAVAETGEYVVTVAAAVPGAPLPYSLAIAWKSQTVFLQTVTLTAGGSDYAAFAADAGASVKLAASARKGSAAVPSIVGVTGPDALPVAVTQTATGAPKGSAALSLAGEYSVELADAGSTGGDLAFKATVRAPKAGKRKLDLRTAQVQDGVSGVGATVVGPAGDDIVGDLSGPLAGTSLSVPPGSLGYPVAILLGAAATVVPTSLDTLEPVGPAVFFGPEGTTFSSPVTITLPYSVASVADTSQLRVYRRNANGTVDEIVGFTVDSVNGRVSFPASHFSVYQVFLRLPITRQRIVASDTTVGDHFGLATAISGSTAVTASRFRTVNGNTSAGAAYVLTKTAGVWSESQILTSPGVAASGLFGLSLAVDDASGVIVIGARGENGSAFRDGRVHVFRRNAGTWLFEQTLVDAGAVNLEGYGSSVAVSGDTIAVGATFRQRATNDYGAVFVYRYSGGVWGLEQRIDAVDTPHAFGSFGTSLALQGNRLAVGDPYGSPSVANTGGAYVYDRTVSTWNHVATFQDVQPVASGGYATSIALDGDFVAVGNPLATVNGSASVGRAYVYRSDGAGTWGIDSTFPGPRVGSGFGSAVGLSGGFLAIGANGDAVAEFHEYLTPFTWALRYRRAPSSTSGLAGYGTSIAIDGKDVIVGAAELGGSTDAGAVELIDITNL